MKYRLALIWNTLKNDWLMALVCFGKWLGWELEIERAPDDGVKSIAFINPKYDDADTESL